LPVVPLSTDPDFIPLAEYHFFEAPLRYSDLPRAFKIKLVDIGTSFVDPPIAVMRSATTRKLQSAYKANISVSRWNVAFGRQRQTCISGVWQRQLIDHQLMKKLSRLAT
jgi:hypothetical protein